MASIVVAGEPAVVVVHRPVLVGHQHLGELVDVDRQRPDPAYDLGEPAAVEQCVDGGAGTSASEQPSAVATCS